MTIPDYHISRVILEEHMQRHLIDDDPREDRPRRHDSERRRRTMTARSLIATPIYRLARLIDPTPTLETPASIRTTP